MNDGVTFNTKRRGGGVRSDSMTSIVVRYIGYKMLKHKQVGFEVKHNKKVDVCLNINRIQSRTLMGV